MNTQKSRFSQMLLTVLVSVYVLVIAALSYANWAADPAHTQWWMTLINIPILSIPLVLVFGSIYVLALAWRERAVQGQVSPRLAKTIHWAPRGAAILIIFFVSLFSLDVFEVGAPPLELLGAFLIHNLPSIGMLVLLILAWKRPALGFAAFLAAAAVFAVVFVRDIYSLPNLLLFVLPLLLIAFLFYVDWRWLRLLPPAQAGPAAHP